MGRVKMRNTYKIFLSKNLKGRNHLGESGIDGRKTLKWILKKIGCEDKDYIHVPQDMGQ
jgi:hypothetical protein